MTSQFYRILSIGKVQLLVHIHPQCGIAQHILPVSVLMHSFLHDLRAKWLRVGNSFSIPVRRKKYLDFFFHSISNLLVKRIRKYCVYISFSFISQLNSLGSTNVLCGNYICNFRSHVFIQTCELYVCIAR